MANVFRLVWDGIRSLAGVSQQGRTVSASRNYWDAAQDDPAITKHFEFADGASADAHASQDARKRIRDRARFEYANACYVRGIVDTHVNGVIGTGPRLAINSEDTGIDSETADLIVRGWELWAVKSRWYERLRLAYLSSQIDGEGLAILSSDEQQEHPVKLAWKNIECDQLTSPMSKLYALENEDGSKHVDGIDVDAFGRPLRYWFLKHHPGSVFASQNDSSAIDAKYVVHLFKAFRPGQCRGVSALAPMLSVAAMLRGYAYAVLKAARRAASVSFVVKTPHVSGSSGGLDPETVVTLPDDAGITLDDGYEIQQLKAEQPTGTYREFKRENVGEMARPFCMPANKAMCDSSQMNYSSGRLDHQDYGLFQRIEQDTLEIRACDVTFEAYCEEAVLRDDSVLFPPVVRNALNTWLQRPEKVLPHSWYWDQVEHADPAKEAEADDKRLLNGTTTYEEVASKRNKNWRQMFEQRAREEALKNELGITEAIAGSKTPQPGQPAAPVPT